MQEITVTQYDAETSRLLNLVGNLRYHADNLNHELSDYADRLDHESGINEEDSQQEKLTRGALAGVLEDVEFAAEKLFRVREELAEMERRIKRS